MNKDIIASIIFGASCFIFFWLAVPVYDNILDIKSATADMQSLLSERTTLRQNVSNLMQQYESRSAEIAKLMMFLPNQSRLDQIIETLQSTAGSTGIQMKDMSLASQPSTNNSPYVVTNIKIEVSGNYDLMVNYMKQLEQSLRIYDVTEISIARNQQAPLAANLFNIEIKANTYSLN
ncbi:MAG: type 4a pilus biogenesis protein PilO [Minisyncoccia bacterium]|jgi:type IV pilus assembly protein PilO